MARHYLWAGVVLLIAAATLRTVFGGDWSLVGLVVTGAFCLLLSFAGMGVEARQMTREKRGG